MISPEKEENRAGDFFMPKLVSSEIVAQKIFVLRGYKVMIDRDLAGLYGVKTIALRQQVKRNAGRFPHDFMFRLTQKETDELITNCDRLSLLKHSAVTPYAFTEQGVAMLSSILKSRKAIQVNIQIMRTFARLKEFLLAHKELAIRLDALEEKFGEHDDKIRVIFEAIRELLDSPRESQKPKIGFHS